MNLTRVSRHIRAPREKVYHALVDAKSVAKWRVPIGMSGRVHAFDARVGGVIRISLTYEAPTAMGKTTVHSDTYHGRFTSLVPNQQVTEIDEFETSDPDLQGEMTITINLADAGEGTDVVATHHGLSSGLSPADNETGWRMALEQLAQLVEGEILED